MEGLLPTLNQVSADLSTVRVWHRRARMEWPPEARMWDNALTPGPGRGPTRNLKLLAVRLGWVPAHGGWTCNGQWFSWDEATLRAKWDSAQVLCAEVARSRKTLRAWLPVFRPLPTDSSSWMDRVRRRTGKLLSTLLLEECGTRN
eukprot:6347297-Amphidinium_carterae.4